MTQPDLFTAPAPVPPRSDRPSFCDKLAAYFMARPGQWFDGMTLGLVAGAYAWRSRVSELRKPPYRMTIENRQRRVNGYIVSEYRFVPETQEIA